MKFWEGKKKLPKAKEGPREVNDINVDYTQTCAKIGQLQYNMKEIEAQMQFLFQRIEELKDENNRRMVLDAKKQAIEKEVAESSAKAGIQ